MGGFLGWDPGGNVGVKEVDEDGGRFEVDVGFGWEDLPPNVEEFGGPDSGDEGAESWNLDLLTPLEGLGDGVFDGVEDGSGLGEGQVRDFSHFLEEVGARDSNIWPPSELLIPPEVTPVAEALG